ncbi:hypothetical protein GCM10020218_094830 [Dactylosporangium vinaceum]|uniref:hypothetical protein n=1 Tax=Dactylosporangium vinaceum TaxID=53362 RepID=UPI001FEAEEDA|nr:hypothetical protein [Dactylosporangium vinaceum]
MTLQRVDGIRRRGAVPHQLDQPAGAHDLTGVQAEDGQHGLAAQPLHRPGLAADHHVYGSK